MSANIRDKSEKEESKGVPLGIKWEWDEDKKRLVFKNLMLNDKKDFYDRSKKNTDEKIDLRSGVPRLIIQNSDKYEGKSEVRKVTNSVITINDVKNAALYMLSKRFYIPAEFERYFNDPKSKSSFEDFLLNLANYFYWFFEAIDSKIIVNLMCIERSPQEKNRIEKAEKMIVKTLKSLARSYCTIILGLGSEEYHHMNAGKNRVSSGFKDRGLYETLYPFCIFFVWITFKRRDYELIRTEIGRLLRSNSFNSEIKVESILEEENRKPKIRVKSENKKESILNRFEENKNLMNEFKSKIQKKSAAAVVLGQRSPALVSILPRPEENSKHLFNRKGESLRGKKIDDEEDEDYVDLIEEIGLIGQPMKFYHEKTLAVLGNNDEDRDIMKNNDAEETDIISSNSKEPEENETTEE
ncbi:phosphatase 1 regulatory subunit 36 isoform X1 [Brachionus plicatilis]|uniref:Phosphatase 1 regulatory subunit 36 isoform X1 n=1 Tax=Brachionus plicatilis TaxID=10195 RepID=A0A3M7QP01_BRAPC|nr:phosphatase 1 regulatory subunit 36 isoform X1 [Brachionus plicatilis]